MTTLTPHASRDLVVTAGWAAALVGWELELLAAARPAGTRSLRTYHLRRLAHDHQGRDPWSLTRTELVGWLAGCQWSTETRRSYRSSLRVFYAWGVAAGLVAVSPAATLPPITPERGLPRPVPSDRLEAAVAGADPRVRLALLLLAETGMRRGECAAMHTDDLLRDVHGWSLRVLGKGRRERRVPIGDDLGQVLELVPRGWVFPSFHRGLDSGGVAPDHITPAHLGRLVSRALGDGWAPHSIRHRFGTLAYAVERDLRAVQELLGHQKIETTTIYTKVPDHAMRRAASASSLMGAR